MMVCSFDQDKGIEAFHQLAQEEYVAELNSKKHSEAGAKVAILIPGMWSTSEVFEELTGLFENLGYKVKL